MTDELDVAIERLTQGQIDCLMLTHQNLTSKKIAPRLGISPHTVDQRIRTALRILGLQKQSASGANYRIAARVSRHVPMASGRR